MKAKLLAVAAFVFISAASFAGFSAMAEPSLDDLFKQLRTVTTDTEAAVVESAIWARWMNSGSPSVDLLMNRGLEAMAGEDYETADKLFTSVVEVSPNFPEGWNKRATLHFLQDDYEGAIADIRETLRLEPRHFGALAGLGKILEAYGDKRRALQAYREALAVNPHLEGLKEDVARLAPEVEGRGI